MNMTTRELLLNTFEGRPTPRVPVAPFIFNNIISEYNSGTPDDPVKACIELYKRFGFDIILRNFHIMDYIDERLISCERWKVEMEKVDLGNGDWDDKMTVSTPERQLTQTKSYRRVSSNETVEAVTEYLIKSREDFEQFKKFQPSIGQYDCSVISYARKLVGNDGLSGPWMHGVFNIAGTYRDLPDLIMDASAEEDFYIEMLEYCYDRAATFVKQLISAGADFISVGGNMASGSIVGPKMFKSHVMSYEIRLIDVIHDLGAKVIYHNCGDMKFMMPMYCEMGIDMLESLAAPPFGDVQLEDVFDAIPLPTVLSGGIDQIDFLRKATPDQVCARKRGA